MSSNLFSNLDSYHNNSDDCETDERDDAPGEPAGQLRILGNELGDYAVSVIETQGQCHGHYRERETECYDCRPIRRSVVDFFDVHAEDSLENGQTMF